MSLFPIFKVNKLSEKNETDVIYVFYGNNLDIDMDPNELFKKDPKNKAFIPYVFTETEIDEIDKNKVIFLNETIHIDDSIGVIKLKIFEALRRSVSMNEIYLFCLKEEKLNPITMYQNLTQNDYLPLTRVRFELMLRNIYDTDGNPVDFDLLQKDKYSFDDILKLDLMNREYLVAKILGQKFVFNNEYPFIANPFLVTEYDKLLEHSRRELTTLNNNLLLETLPIFKNTIYLCLAENVFQKLKLSIKYSCKIYYPFLYRENIETIEKLQNNRNELIEATSNKLTKEVEKGFENIDMFYDVFRYRDKKVSKKFSEKINNTGIKFIKITIHPDFKIKIPVDVIFKLIHSTKEYPLVKFNPETRQENIYRLYTEQITEDGRKIPLLNKATIFKLMRTIGKGKSVAVYTNTIYKGVNYYMACEFEDNGSISVFPLTDFDTPIILDYAQNPYNDIDNIINLAVNPLIEQIKPFFEQSGLEIPLFKSIQSANIEIRDISYQFIYSITNQIDIMNYIGCISSVFTVESQNIKKGIEMRFKRVANFNKRDSQEAFIIEKIDQGLKFDEIIEELVKNYNDTNEETAADLIAKIRTELEVTRGVNKRRALMIKINPGFKTRITLNSITSEITIIVDGINDINYLNTIPVYIDTLIRISQDPKSSRISPSKIKKLCSGKELEDIEFGQITSQSEKNIENNEVPDIDNEYPIYSENKTLNDSDELRVGENMDDLLDILGYDDDEDILSNSKGGQLSSSSSEKSVSTESLGSSISTLASASPLAAPTSKQAADSIRDTSSDRDVIVEKEEIKEPEKPQEMIEDVEVEEEVEIKMPPKREKKIETVAKDLENTVRNIIGMKLKYPNPFSARLETRAPQLFVREKNEKFDVYTRMCPFSLNDRRQPVILTKEEKDDLIEEQPEINQEADFIEYSTDPNDSSKKYYYTCPRFWCMLTDKMVTEKDILDGKCGPKVNRVEDAIIPKSADKIKGDNRYVYQFYDETERNYPGFHKKKTPNGLCIPCCYNKWSTEEMKNRRNICQGKYNEKESQSVSNVEKGIEEELRRDIQEVENYVKGPEKYGPQLGEHRWGFLPIAVQKFLHEVNEECQVSKMDTSLKPNHMCILRHGVETNSKQSFIACIASALFYVQEDKNTKNPLITKFIPNAKYDVPSIKEMKDLIIKAIDIDKFVKYQNGDLITSFANPEANVDIYKSEYKESKLYKKIEEHRFDNEINKNIVESENSENNEGSNQGELTKMSSNKPLEFFTRVIQAYENFISFLKDNSIYIDYTYLWDLVCTPNLRLFEEGINLIILEMPEDDITNNIELVCPTNRYSAHIYDTRKRTLILLKRENYFEPIYGYRNDLKKNKILITTTFSEHDGNLPASLRAVFKKIIKPTLGEKCRPLLSRPNEYRFKHPPLLDNLIESLIYKKYTVLKQVLNFQGKVIGVLTKSKKGIEGFVPCYPSSLTMLTNSKNKMCDNEENCEYDFVYMTDDIWKSYDETLTFLKEYYDYKKNNNDEKSTCYADNSFCRVVNNELIIGFLTNTNQFIQIHDPIPVSSVDDNIKTFTNNDMLVADIETLTTLNVDTKRTNYIKKIQLETNFYNVFRNTIRILFNDYSNSDKRKAIQDICNKKYVLYNKQLDKVIDMLYDLVGDSIIFSTEGEGFNYKNINENEIHNCIKLSKNKCKDDSESGSGICRITGDKCSLILPKNNLITNTDNEAFYYGRMADELIRYNRIKLFIFKPQAYLSFGQIKYNLRDNEILILQDLLNQDFFENLIPADINKYAKYNTYDTTKPIISQKYNNDVELDAVINPNDERNCFQSNPEKIKSDFWKKCFPSKYREVIYTGSNYCALYLIIDIVREIQNRQLTVENVKMDLIEEYKRLTDHYTDMTRVNTIIHILKEEGQYDANQLLDKSIDFEQMILHEGFYAVNFDLWLLLTKYKIQSIFISSKTIPETRFNRNGFVCYIDNSDIHSENYKKKIDFVFIVTPAMYRREKLKNPEYKLIMDENKGISISLDVLTDDECLYNIEQYIKIYHSIEEYVDVKFKKDNTTKYKRRVKGIRENIEFIEDESRALMGDQNQDVIVKKKSKKITPTIILEEENEEDLEPPKTEPLELELVEKPKTRGRKPNPLGKTKKIGY
jgi:hypothetical protein